MRCVNHQKLRLLSLAIMSCNQGWTRNETDAAGGDSKETKPIAAATLRLKLSKSLPNVAYCLFVARVKLYSRNRIYSKYHYHASAYSLQTVGCRFVYLYEENANTADTYNWSRLTGWAGNAMAAEAQQPITAIAAGDSAVTPPHCGLLKWQWTELNKSHL